MKCELKSILQKHPQLAIISYNWKMFLQNTFWHEFWLFIDIHISSFKFHYPQHQCLKMIFLKHFLHSSYFILAWIFTQFHVLIMDIQISTYDHLHLNFITLSWIFIFPIPIFSKRFYSFWIVTKLICVIFTVCELKRND